MQTASPQPKKRLIRVKLNGRWREDAVAENHLLVDYLRDVARRHQHPRRAISALQCMFRRERRAQSDDDRIVLDPLYRAHVKAVTGDCERDA